MHVSIIAQFLKCWKEEKVKKKNYLPKFRIKQGQMTSLSLKQWFLTKGDLIFLPPHHPHPLEHSAMSADIFGCHILVDAAGL